MSFALSRETILSLMASHPIVPKVSIFLAQSLDGYIARDDGGLDWLDLANRRVPAGEDCGFARFFASTDVVVLGRKSFEKVLEFPTWPYADRPIVVLSRKPEGLTVPESLRGSVRVLADEPAALVRRLGIEGFGHIYLDGGQVVQSFLGEGLVDELTLTVIPVLLGSGLRCFGELREDQSFRLLNSRAFEFGYVQLTYARAREQAN